MLCPKCGKPMKNVKHYEAGRSYQYNRCECAMRTHQKRIHYEEVETKQNYNEQDENESKETR